MAIPIRYNIRSVTARWRSALVAILGIAGTVAVFIAVLALAEGFRATLVSSGHEDNAIVRRAGATSEMDSTLTKEQLRIIESAPGIARGTNGPLVSGENVVVVALPLITSGTDANVRVRGVGPQVQEVRTNIRLAEGRFLQPGLAELVVGRHATGTYAGLTLGAQVVFGGRQWTVVGIFDGGSSAFDSEVWADATLLAETFSRPAEVLQSATVRLNSPTTFTTFEHALATDPRLTIQTQPELDFYESQSSMLTKLITVLGVLIAIVMGLGAIFGALNTMYAAVAERAGEIGTLRAVGFGQGSIIVGFIIEALIIAGIGGLLGCLFVLPIDGFTTGTVNWQTFSHLTFDFKVTPQLLGQGLIFALLMGIIGGLGPAIRAVRAEIVTALRQL